MFNCNKLPLIALISCSVTLSGCGGSDKKSTEPADKAQE